MAFYVGDALTEIRKIKATADGHLDFSTVPEFAKKTVNVGRQKISIVKGKEVMEKEIKVEVHRDIGATLSMLTVAVQQLIERIEKLEGK